MNDDADSGWLSDEEAALVFRRATELDREDLHRPGGWDLAALEEVGREVGIAPEAIRAAVGELRVGSIGGAELATSAPVVRCTRIVSGEPAAVRAALDTWLTEQLFEPVRDRAGSAVYTARQDRQARKEAGRDKDGRLRLRHVGRLVVAVAPAGTPGRTAVRIEAELARSRRDRAWLRWREWATPAAWVGGGVVLVMESVVLLHALAAAPFVGAGLAGAAWRRAGIDQSHDLAAVELTVEGALDRLER